MVHIQNFFKKDKERDQHLLSVNFDHPPCQHFKLSYLVSTTALPKVHLSQFLSEWEKLKLKEDGWCIKFIQLVGGGAEIWLHL